MMVSLSTLAIVALLAMIIGMVFGISLVKH